MKPYLYFIAVAFLLTQGSPAGVASIGNKTIAIAPEEGMAIAADFGYPETIATNISAESGSFTPKLSNSIVFQAFNPTLRHPPYLSQTLSNLEVTETHPIGESAAMVLIGLGLIGLAGVCRNQLKKRPSRVSSIKVALINVSKSVGITIRSRRPKYDPSGIRT